jgi:hypothetical protein
MTYTKIYVVYEQFTQNIQIPRKNNITFIILIKHTSIVWQVKIEAIS